MYMPTEMHVTQHMLDEILERLEKDSTIEDRLAVRRWYEQMPIHLQHNMLQGVMVVEMHGPDADTIAGAINGARFAYSHATLLMIELGAMWYIDLHGLSSNDADDLWQQLEEKYADYKTETSKGLTGVFGIGFKDREEYERCFDRFIDFRNHFPGSLTSWLIEHNNKELAGWWLSSWHEALEDGIWPHAEHPERDRAQLRHEVRQLANHLNISAPLIRHLNTLTPLLEGSNNHD